MSQRLFLALCAAHAQRRPHALVHGLDGAASAFCLRLHTAQDGSRMCAAIFPHRFHSGVATRRFEDCLVFALHESSPPPRPARVQKLMNANNKLQRAVLDGQMTKACTHSRAVHARDPLVDALAGACEREGTRELSERAGCAVR